MNNQIFFSAPEIVEWCNEAQLRDNYGIEFKENGWYVTDNDEDHALVIERHGKYRVWVWIRNDPRDEMEKVLDLPLFND